MEEDSNSRMTEKNWRMICERLKADVCPKLESIHIPGNHIGYQGVEALVELYQDGHLKECKELDLSGNGIGDKGAIALAHLFELPRVCKDLRLLNMANNRIGSKGWHMFIDHFITTPHLQLTELDLSCK